MEKKCFSPLSELQLLLGRRVSLLLLLHRAVLFASSYEQNDLEELVIASLLEKRFYFRMLLNLETSLEQERKKWTRAENTMETDSDVIHQVK